MGVVTYTDSHCVTYLTPYLFRSNQDFLMKLIVIGSNSAGNGYALDAGGEILLLEAGLVLKSVKSAIDFRTDKVVGCLVTHEHGDHAKYAESYTKNGITIYGNKSLMEKKNFAFGSHVQMVPEKTYHIGGFDVVPFINYHDVEIFGYIIRHPQMGILFFSTDSYKIGMTIKGVDHFLIEANYSDELLKKSVWSGKIQQPQADRIMTSHMSLDYCIRYLRDCEADKSAKTITLCHLSERNSNHLSFRNIVAGSFGVPTYVAEKGAVIELNKDSV